VQRVGGWTRLRGTCEGREIEGWAPADTVPTGLGAPPAALVDEAALAELDTLRREAELAAAESRWDAAIAAFDRAIALAPTDPALRDGRGHALYEEARVDRALEDLALCLSMMPDNTSCDAHARDAEDLLVGEREVPADAASEAGAAGPAGTPIYETKKLDREKCRLDEGVALEVLNRRDAWVKVRGRCGGREVTGFVGAEAEGER
jgi:tetratricopeptide (TPR) repeat protein